MRLAIWVLFVNQAIVRFVLAIPAQNVIILIIVIFWNTISLGVSASSGAQLGIAAEKRMTSCSVR